MRLLLAFVAAVFALHTYSATARAFEVHTATIDAKNGCNIIVQNSGQGSQKIGTIVCPTQVFRKFNVRYVWLNHAQLSLLLAGHSDDSFAAVLGRNANIHRNDVYEDITHLFQAYGSRLSANSVLFGDITTLKVSAEESDAPLVE